MTAAAVTLARAGAQPVPVRRGYRFELVKLLAQWPIRLVLLACWLGPALFVAVISEQSSLPADTVFGRWMSQTASLVAGDVFATEDRLAGLAASAVVGGLAAVGNRPLVGLDGNLLAPGQATGAVLLAWASALAPTS